MDWGWVYICTVLYPYPCPLYPSRLMNEWSLTKPVLTTKRAGVYLNSSIAMFSPLTVVSVLFVSTTQQCWWQFCQILNEIFYNNISLSCPEWKLLSLIFSLRRSSGSRAAELPTTETPAHGIMGRRFQITSYSSDHVWTSNIVFPTTPGRLIQFLLGDWSAEISCDQ